MTSSAGRTTQPARAAALQRALAPYYGTVPLPQPGDHVIFLRGVPVVPWIALRPVDVVWSAWLAQLRRLWERWPRTADATRSDWETWRAAHIHSLQAQRTGEGVDMLALLLAEQRLSGAALHIVGHSVGGAAALTYLTGLRSGVLGPPTASLRSVITIDAAIAGLAGVWTGTRSMLGTSADRAFQQLGSWAATRGISVLTTCNECDIWSHRMVADLPYLGLRVGPRYGTLAQINGRTHKLLRLTPQFVRAIWALPDDLVEDAPPLPVAHSWRAKNADLQ